MEDYALGSRKGKRRRIQKRMPRKERGIKKGENGKKQTFLSHPTECQHRRTALNLELKTPPPKKKEVGGETKKQKKKRGGG